MFSRSLVALLLFALPLGNLGCADDDPTAPSTGVPAIQSLGISIAGVDVTNQNISPGMGGSTLFRARPESLPPGTSVWVQMHSPSMMGGQHEYRMMYDDGTHGDMTPGDGEFCHEDVEDMPGMHMQGAMMGHYEFEFHCQDGEGNHGPHEGAWVHLQ